MRRRDWVNRDLVSVSVDGSYEDLVWHKGIDFLFSQKKSLFNSEHYSVDINDYKDGNYQLSTTNDE